MEIEPSLFITRMSWPTVRVAGAFHGWKGSSEYKLANGQTWRQSAYHYEYTYAYRPHALVYEAPSGTIMAVAGTLTPTLGGDETRTRTRRFQ